MRELALFAGAAGGVLGGLLLGWRTVCAVELNAYCRSVLLARQRDGILPRFPIWDDVRTFDGRPWRGAVDVISGGFPCQPFSSAAHGLNVAVDLWPEMLRIVGEVEPAYVFAENVKRKPIAQAAEDLRAAGYVVRCARVSAASLGAPHRRERWWLVANSNGCGKSRVPEHGQVGWAPPSYGSRLWVEHRPELLGVDDGVAHRMDRLAALGNGQVAGVAALAWEHLAR